MCHHAWLFKWVLRITTQVVMLEHDFVHWAISPAIAMTSCYNFALIYCSNLDLECSPSAEGLVFALWYYREVVEFLWPPIGKLLSLYQKYMHWKGNGILSQFSLCLHATWVVHLYSPYASRMIVYLTMCVHSNKPTVHGGKPWGKIDFPTCKLLISGFFVTVRG